MMMATRDPGIFLESLGIIAMMKMLTRVTPAFHQLTVVICLK